MRGLVTDGVILFHPLADAKLHMPVRSTGGAQTVAADLLHADTVKCNTSVMQLRVPICGNLRGKTMVNIIERPKNCGKKNFCQ